MVQAPKGKVPAKKQTVKFVLDCSQPVNDNILDAPSLERYFQDRIKVDGKLHNLGEKIQIGRDGSKISISAELPFSKRYIKYLAKRYLKKQQVREFLRVVATQKNSYELCYFRMKQQDDEE